MKRLYNLRTDKNIPEDSVRIDRGTPWGNPFVLHSEKERDIVCDRFEQEILPTLDLTPLIGKALVCWCYPKRCHGMSILRRLRDIERKLDVRDTDN